MPALKLTFEAIGTHWQITADVPHTTSARKAVLARIEEFDKAYSRFRSDSWVTKVSRAAGTYDLPPDGYELLTFYKQLYDASSGSVTPLIGQVVSDAGYDAGYSLQPKKLTRPKPWDEALHFTRGQITLSCPALLDFGAAGKGYLVDIVGSVLRDAGAEEYTINAGGDILRRTSGNEALTVGLENPYNLAEVIGIAHIRNQSICASSGSRRKWGGYTHIIDPHSLRSPKGIQSVWVIADSAMLADGLATALFFVDPAKLREKFKFTYAILRGDMSLEYARDFPVAINEAAS